MVSYLFVGFCFGHPYFESYDLVPYFYFCYNLVTQIYVINGDHTWHMPAQMPAQRKDVSCSMSYVIAVNGVCLGDQIVTDTKDRLIED